MYTAVPGGAAFPQIPVSLSTETAAFAQISETGDAQYPCGDASLRVRRSQSVLPELSSLRLSLGSWSICVLCVLFPTFSGRVCCNGFSEGQRGYGFLDLVGGGLRGTSEGCEVFSRAVVYEEG